MLGRSAAGEAMFEIRPPLVIVGLVLIATGVGMLLPAVADYSAGSSNWTEFLKSAFLTILTGSLLAIACYSPQLRGGLNVRQAFLMTAVGWTLVPAFGAMPLMTGAPGLSFTDAYFEAVSGFTTTGSTVIPGLDGLPPGANLWRGLMNWMGGLGFSFLALVFLPFLRVGGMKFFESTGYNTMGKVMPRAHEIAGALLRFYVLLTIATFISYRLCGMEPLPALIHAFGTVSCGGFSPFDRNFGAYPGAAEYCGALFMVLACLPFIRYIQLLSGSVRPILRDSQIHTFLLLVVISVAATTLWRLATGEGSFEPTLRTSLFNIVSMFSGTGFSSADVASWGGFAVGIGFAVGMIGGCSSSTSGAISVFRWQIALLAIRQKVLKLQSPNRVLKLRYQGREVEPDVLSSTIAFMTAYAFVFGIASTILALSGVDLMSAIFAIWTSLGNIGFGIGDLVQRTGTMVDFPQVDKWVMSASMLLGRVGIMPMLVVLLPRFWRI